ncbi:MAG: HAD family phosphatase [Crocinitomicaceae bacterium]|nr:HAD family phosphatase [Crocinitomicaceae bacterium]MDG1776225.1 HAD family phosphatase [Crocinitomicaceae bacterium]
MIDKSVKAVIFDFGGVIINIDYHATIEAFKALGIADFESMYTQAQQSDLFNQIEIGEISAQRFINGILDFLPAGISPNKVVSAWNAMIKDVPIKAIDLLVELKKKGYRIFLLSNTNEIHLEAAIRAWEKTSSQHLDSIFNAVYLSHKIGMRKPNKHVFDFVCQQENLTPSETLFIDDSIQHIEGAASIGLQTHHLLRQEDLYTLFS